MVYVDDIVVTESDEKEVQRIIDLIDDEFATRKLGELKIVLGIQAHRTKDAIQLSQQQYFSNLLQSCRFEILKSSMSPMQQNFNSLSEEEPISNDKEFKRIMGSLQYLTLIGPNIPFSVSKVAQSMAKPQLVHWEAMMHYLLKL